MKRVLFKPYLGVNKLGEIAIYDCSAFGTKDLIEMLNQPKTLKVINFKSAHALWSQYMHDLFTNDIKECSKWMNYGFVNSLAKLGYRIVPDVDEIEILKD